MQRSEYWPLKLKLPLCHLVQMLQLWRRSFSTRSLSCETFMEDACLRCFWMCCTLRENRSPSVWLCCSTIKSLCPQNSLLLLIPPSYTFISITPNGCRCSARRNWSVFNGNEKSFNLKGDMLLISNVGNNSSLFFTVQNL